ncbi:hypothetical protein Gpo141_00013666 [Globisporangium polare]
MRNIACFYAPRCTETFASDQKVKQHCKSAHGGYGLPFCSICPELKVFKHEKSMTNHVRNHEAKSCDHCTQPVSRANWARHLKSCSPQVDVEAPDVEYLGDEAEEKTNEVIPGEPLFHLPPTDTHRHPNRAPAEADFSINVERFVQWVASDTSLGKGNSIREPKPFVTKFRTVLGKLAAYHKLDTKAFMVRLNRADHCLTMFQPAVLSGFTTQLENHVDGEDKKLNKSTVYNYLRALIVYLSWRVDILGQVSLKPSLTLLKELAVAVSKRRKSDIDPQAKADRLKELPSMPDIVDFMDSKLKTAMDQARVGLEQNSVTNLEAYMAFRNYFLVVLLFGVPPQRLQIFNLILRREVTLKGDLFVMTVRRHKTHHIYGPVVVVLPPRYKSDFVMFLQLRDGLAIPGCASLFVDLRGDREPYLTKRFQGLIYNEFGKAVSIRDCRSIYVTWANKRLDIKQMFELARQMNHSFQTQQLVYRADDSTQRAIDSIKISDQVNNVLSKALPMVVMRGDTDILHLQDKETDPNNNMDVDDDADSDDSNLDNPTTVLLARHDREKAFLAGLSTDDIMDTYDFLDDAAMLAALDQVESRGL